MQIAEKTMTQNGHFLITLNKVSRKRQCALNTTEIQSFTFVVDDSDSFQLHINYI